MITFANCSSCARTARGPRSTNSSACWPMPRRTTIACAARLRMFGTATGRWSGLGPQLQNLKKNESGLPLSVVDSVRNGDRVDIARYGAPLALLGDISRAALCAAPGMELKSGDFSRDRKRGPGLARRRAMEARRLPDLFRERRHDARALSGDRAQDAQPGGRTPRSTAPSGSSAKRRNWRPGSAARSALGVASCRTIRAPTTRSKPSFANGARRIPGRSSSGKI